jgi:hypothetical protein
MTYTPDNWLLIKVDNPKDPHYRILGGWSGGYAKGDTWRLNSGVASHEEDKDYYYFHGSSGSTYKCNKASRQARKNMSQVLGQIEQNDLCFIDTSIITPDFDWIINE